MADKENIKTGGRIAKRDLATAIILSIITCGIYGIYWFIVLSDDVNTLTDDRSTSGATAFILTLITCGIYGIFWVYKLGKRMYDFQKANGENATDNSVLYVILEIFGLGIVSFALLQDSLNKYAE